MNDLPGQAQPRYSAKALTEFAARLLQRAGLPEARARCVAETLVAADLMGHTTHGLQLLPAYLQDLENGDMTAAGDPEVISDRGAAITWDGRHLPGPWLVHRALDLAFERIADHPVVTVAIRRSHHIAALAAFLERATERGLLMILASGDPGNRTVAPYGGVEGVYSPDPIAVGIPTGGAPVLIDISASTTANGVIAQKYKNGERLPHPWLLDPAGRPTDDPAAFFADPPATVLPLGGLDTGYKGFALGLLIEALVFGLPGYGRADRPDIWQAGVFLQVIDPQAFGGRDPFQRQTGDLAAACRSAATPPGSPPVRLPGDRARQLRTRQLEQGVWLYPTILPGLEHWAERYQIELPPPL